MSAPQTDPTSPLSSFRIPSLFDVTSLTCVVTGGSSGLGLYAAHALASNGALVYILGRRKPLLDSTVSQFHALLPTASSRQDGDLVAVQADITSKESLSNARDVITADLASRGKSGINLLICNAGIGGRFLRSYGSSPPTSSEDKDKEFTSIVDELSSFSEDEINSILNTNVTGNYLTALTFLPLLKSATTPTYPSQTILISSNAAWAKLPILNPIYNISKTALSQLGQILSTMFADHGLRTNIIEPGLYPSDLTSTEGRDERTGHARLSHTNGADIPVGRCGRPEEHASAVVYLASRNSAFANGCTMRVDGGALQKLPASD
ncbi:Short chain dehydrogenase/reductase [Pseudozyma hubeiensis]|nr:Short chain dehydrogenase/reductase [Pseudozyma hubeiensis]